VTTSESAAPGTNEVLPVEQYVAGLARKRMAAGVLFRDKAGRVLLLKPVVQAQLGDSRRCGGGRRVTVGNRDPRGRRGTGVGATAGPVAGRGLRAATGLSPRGSGLRQVKPLLADRLAVALHAAEHGATALCEQRQRIA
jgi:hypothetical protein